MIRVTRLDGKLIWLNADWMQSIEATPDTLITLVNGMKILVRDSVDEVAISFKRYKREVRGLHVVPLPSTEENEK